MTNQCDDGLHQIPGTPFRIGRGAHWPWEVNVYLDGVFVASTDIDRIRDIRNHLQQKGSSHD